MPHYADMKLLRKLSIDECLAHLSAEEKLHLIFLGGQDLNEP